MIDFKMTRAQQMSLLDSLERVAQHLDARTLENLLQIHFTAEERARASWHLEASRPPIDATLAELEAYRLEALRNWVTVASRKKYIELALSLDLEL